MKNLSIALSIICVGLSIFSIHTYNQNYRLSLVNYLSREEIRLLTYEKDELEKKRTYEDGMKDQLIKMGANGSEGFNNGYDSAVSLLANSSYENGYHNCIQQFSYQKPSYQRFLVPEPKKDTETAKITKIEGKE